MGKTDQPCPLNRHDLDLLSAGRHDRPFDILGPHAQGRQNRIVAFMPDVSALGVVTQAGGEIAMERVEGDVFAAVRIVSKGKFSQVALKRIRITGPKAKKHVHTEMTVGSLVNSALNPHIPHVL